MYRVSPFVRRFAWALLGGAGLATVWVNLSPERYYDFIEWRLFDRPLPGWVAGETVLVTPMSLVSDGLMSLFLFFIGKELWESLVLERGALRGRRALLPSGAMLGGILGAVVAWILWSALFETAYEGGGAVGWPVPIGADVVIGSMIGRRIFGPSHPALHFLLLTAIGSNIAGLLVLGLAFPGTGLKLLWLVLPLRFSFVELQQASLVFSILCWLWLLWAWGKHVIGEWPAPIWGHWIVGTLLWVLPLTAVIVLMIG